MVKRSSELTPVRREKVFDFSRPTQEERYRQCLHDQDWKKHVLKFFSQGEQLVRSNKYKEREGQSILTPNDPNRPIGDLYYSFYVLEQAVEIIKKLFPSLSSELETAGTRMAIADQNPDTLSADYEEEYFYMASSYKAGFHIIDIPGTLTGSGLDRYFTAFHSFRVYGTAHELLHIVLTERFNLVNYGGGGTLLESLMESLSLAAEEAVWLNMKKNTTDTKALAKIKHFRDTGRDYSMMNYDFWRDRGQWKGSDEASHVYREGWLIAKILRRNGWTWEQLPQLLDEIEELLIDIFGPNYAIKISKEKISRAKGSKYEEFLFQLGGLKPDVSS